MYLTHRPRKCSEVSCSPGQCAQHGEGKLYAVYWKYAKGLWPVSSRVIHIQCSIFSLPRVFLYFLRKIVRGILPLLLMGNLLYLLR